MDNPESREIEREKERDHLVEYTVTNKLDNNDNNVRLQQQRRPRQLLEPNERS